MRVIDAFPEDCIAECLKKYGELKRAGALTVNHDLSAITTKYLAVIERRVGRPCDPRFLAYALEAAFLSAEMEVL